MSLKYFNFDFSDYIFLQIKDFLRRSSAVQNKPDFNPICDESLRLSLSEFQRNKRLKITDGALNIETFQAFGEEMNEGELRSILFHRPELKSLFTSGKTRHKLSLEPSVVMVPLNIVYDPKSLPSDARGKDARQFVKDSFRPKLEYWEETFRKLYLGYTVDFTVGACNKDRNQIINGAKAGYINIYFLDDGHRKLGAYAVTYLESRHIFISEQANDKMYRRSLCHEICHFFGITSMTGFRIIDYFLPSNIISDARINFALRQLKANSVRYGVDWVDDYRVVSENIPLLFPGNLVSGPRVPTIYDIIRVGAMILREQKK